MIVEQRTYTLHAGKAADYLAAYQAEGLAIQRPILGNLVGYFSTEFGPLNQIVHIWAYEDLADRGARRARLGADPRWKAYVGKVQPFVITQENKLLIPAPFSPWANGPAYTSN
jgi:NIPSNAP